MTRKRDRIHLIYAMLFALFQPASLSLADSLPDGFVYLSEVEPTIAQDIRYATSKNFTGAAVPGYHVAECVLRADVALALTKVQDDLRASGYSLKVLDCYRPIKAVSWFVQWSMRGGPSDPDYYPAVERSKLIQSGYIARKSGHSTGNSVDLTILSLAPRVKNEVDMGTSFDFFDPKSHAKSSQVTRQARRSREILSEAMTSRGFKPYWREWWHFTYINASASASGDFDIDRAK